MSGRGVRRASRLAAAVLTATALAGACSNSDDKPSGPASSSPAGAREPVGEVAPTGRVPFPDPVAGTDGRPPTVVVGTPGGPVPATLGSWCWQGRCVDQAYPDVARLPDIGVASKAPVAFPLVGQWSADVRDEERATCATYPVLVEPQGKDRFDLTPSGPPGPRLASFFVNPRAGGTVSGSWRWTVPRRDGEPLAWMSLVQDRGQSGQQALRLVLDDAAVDGDVSAVVTLEPSDQPPVTVPLPRVDQHCQRDGVVVLGTAGSLPRGTLDDLGPLPYGYSVDITVDGTTYNGSGVLTGRGVVGGGDTRLDVSPPLPAYVGR